MTSQSFLLFYAIYLYLGLILGPAKLISTQEAALHQVVSNLAFLHAALHLQSPEFAVPRRYLVCLCFVSGMYHYLQVNGLPYEKWKDADHAVTVLIFVSVYCILHKNNFDITSLVSEYGPVVILVVILTRESKGSSTQWYEYVIAALAAHTWLLGKVQTRHVVVLLVSFLLKSHHGDKKKGTEPRDHYLAHSMWHVFAAYLVVDVLNIKRRSSQKRSRRRI